MGRSNYSFIPNGYLLYPIPVPSAGGVGIDTTVTRIPIYIGNSTIADSLNRSVVPILGMLWGASSTVNAGGNTAAVMMQDSVGGADLLQGNLTLGSTSTTPVSGLERLGYSDESSGWKQSKAGLSSTGQAVVGNLTLAGTGAFVDPAFQILCSPGSFVNAAGNSVAPTGQRLGSSDTRGPWTGTYFGLALQEVDVASGGAADAVVREVVCPVGMKVHAVVLQAAGSGTANLVQVYNATQAVLIDEASSTLISTTPATKIQKIGSGLRTSTTGRNIAAGDLIQLRTDTGAAGFTRVHAMIYGIVTSHFNPAGARNFRYAGTAASVPATHEKVTKNLSGPVVGGVIPLYLGADDVASGKTDELVMETTCPCPGTIFHAQIMYSATGAANTASIINETQADAAIVTDLDIASNDAAVAGTLTNTSVNRDDVIQLTATTVGTGLTAVGAVLLLHVTDHINTDPLQD